MKKSNYSKRYLDINTVKYDSDDYFCIMFGISCGACTCFSLHILRHKKIHRGTD